MPSPVCHDDCMDTHVEMLTVEHRGSKIVFEIFRQLRQMMDDKFVNLLPRKAVRITIAIFRESS